MERNSDYYYVNGGAISVEDEGNELTKANAGGEGKVYRRRQKIERLSRDVTGSAAGKPTPVT